MDKEILTKEYVNSYVVNQGKTLLAIIIAIVVGLITLAGVIAFVVALVSAMVTKVS